MPTPRNPDTAIGELTVRVKRLIGSRPEMMFEGIGISLPGGSTRNREDWCSRPT